MLDNVIDINNYPDEIYENYQKAFRSIGLGVTGFADMLVMLGYDYNSEIAQKFAYDLMNKIAFSAYKASIELASEKESFSLLDVDKYIESGYLQKHVNKHPEWQEIIDGIKKYGIRNSKLLSVAPVGTLSLTFGNNCSSGIEPIFSLEYDRKIKTGGQEDKHAHTVTVRDYAYDVWLNTKKNNVVSKEKFTTALEMSVDSHINMLKQIAFHVDMSTSKTLNIPTNYSEEDTKEVYMKCWEVGIKGCTIFRPNKLRPGILISKQDQKSTQNDSVAHVNGLSRGDIIQTDDELIGRRRSIMSGCGSIHCQAYFDPITGDLTETFFSKGGTGGCNSFMVGLSRMVSLAARGGIHIDSIIDQLNSCPPCPSYSVRRATRHDTSKGACCPIAIGYALKEMQLQIYDELGTFMEDKEDQENDTIVHAECPECGENTSFEGGCIQCKSCGWSKCN